jgi:Holliday junction resolvase RusA-like endonuclease
MPKRPAIEDLDVPDYAHDVPKGYPTYATSDAMWDLQIHIYAPMIASPRPRVTTKGTFMPSDYRKHCKMLGASMAYARGIVETKYLNKKWDAASKMLVDLAFWAPHLVGDLDNMAKTILDAGQLHKGEETGAELWTNDRQIHQLNIAYIATSEQLLWQTVIRVRPTP